MAVKEDQKTALIEAFRDTESLSAAAEAAGVSERDAEEVLRTQGFDLNERDWFFEAAADSYARIWNWLGPWRARTAALASRLFGRIPGARWLSAKLRAGASRFAAWLTAWSGRHPVKKSVAALLLASVFLTAYWLVYPEWQSLVGFLFFGSFVIGAGLLYLHTRSRRILGSSGVVVLALALYAGTNTAVSVLDLSFAAALVVEALRAVLIPVLAWAFLDALRQATGFLEKLRIHVPLVSAVVTMALFIAGTAVAFGELYLLTAFSADPDSVRFVARYGVSYVLWALASASLLFTQLYLLYLSGLTSLGPVTTRRVAVGMITGTLLVGFVLSNAVTMLSAQPGGGPGPMTVGIHTNNVTAGVKGPWDPFVHLEVTWKNVEREPGVLDWSRYDAQLALANASGIEVYLLVSVTPPDWFVETHLDAAMRDQQGRLFRWVDEDPRVEAIRVWEFSFASEAVVGAKENYTRAATARYGDHPAVVAVAIQNEPTWPADFDVTRMASYDADTVAAFRQWLAGRLGTLDALNEAYGTDYGTWAEVQAPKGSDSRLWEDWLTFREELLIQFVDRLVGAARANTAKPVTVKIMAHYLTRYLVVQTGLTEPVLKAFIEASDVVSVDLYPLSRTDLRRALVYFNGLAGGKPLWITEFNLFMGCTTPGSGSTMYAALMDMSRFAERVILFTWEGHYLYGVRLYASVPGLVGIEMFRADRDGGSPWGAYGGLLAADVGAVPNLYGAYLLASAFANVPVIPWPILVLFLLPIPVPDPQRKRRLRRRLWIVALILLIVATVFSNVAF